MGEACTNPCRVDTTQRLVALSDTFDGCVLGRVDMLPPVDAVLIFGGVDLTILANEIKY